ncbi:hypothetical protein [Geopseudomonas aromaticivorans]
MNTCPQIARDPKTRRYWDGESFSARTAKEAKVLSGIALVSVRYCFERAELTPAPRER